MWGLDLAILPPGPRGTQRHDDGSVKLDWQYFFKTKKKKGERGPARLP